MKDDSQYEAIRSRIKDSAMHHFSSESVASKSTLENMRDDVMGVLGDPECDDEIKAEVIAFARAIAVLLNRSLGDLNAARDYRLKFYKIYNYSDESIKEIRYVIENLSSGMSDADLVKWHNGFSNKLDSGSISAPNTIVGSFVDLVGEFPLPSVLKEARAQQI